jgi:hypothetical protein
MVHTLKHKRGLADFIKSGEMDKLIKKYEKKAK